MSQEKPKVCFDTSVFNALLDDEECERLVSIIKESTKPLITSLAMIEVVATPDDQRRHSLLSLMKRLSDGTRPVAMPNKLLRRATRGFGKTAPRMILTVTEEDLAFWDFLDDPSLATESERLKALKWKNSLEHSFNESHALARAPFQEIFAENPSDRPRSVAALFRYFKAHDKEIYTLVAKQYKRITGRTLARAALWHFFTRVPDWPLFLAAWGHEMFGRAIRETNYGRRGKPGNLDLWAGGYLPYCAVFVTNDTGEGRGGQFRALRLLNQLIPVNDLRPRRATILTYPRFKAELLAIEGK